MLEAEIRKRKAHKDILLMTHIVLGYPSFDIVLGFEVVVDIAYRHASRLRDVRQTRLSETAPIR